MNKDWYIELKERINNLRNTPDHFMKLELNNLYLFIDSLDKENRKMKVCDGCPDRYKGCRLDWYQDVLNFHKQIVLRNFPEQPCIPEKQLKLLHGKLIIEEISETLDAIDRDDIIELADGICDSIVVLLETAIIYGIDIRPIWDEVHRTNMAKKGGKLRGDGRLMKPEGWKPPDIKRLIKKQKINNNGK